MRKLMIILMLLMALFLLADDYYTNNPRMSINNPTDGDILSWNSDIRAFDSGATLASTYAGIYHVDADGGGDYTTIQSAITAIEALAALGDYVDSKYILKVSPGTYTENLTITNLKYLRIEMAGVKIDGTVTLTTTQQGGDYYSKLEFWGGMSNRPEKGDNAEITGNITGTRNNDSLIYLSFTGIELSGNLGFTTNGTWVVFMNHCYMSNGSAYFYGDFTGGAGSPSVLLETMGLTRFKAHISSLADTTTNVSLYDVIDTEFDLIDITPSFGGTVRNCEFKSDVTISSGTYEFDNFSYGEAVRQTEDFTGATITFMDNYNGGDVTIAGILSIADTTKAQVLFKNGTDVVGSIFGYDDISTYSGIEITNTYYDGSNWKNDYPEKVPTCLFLANDIGSLEWYVADSGDATVGIWNKRADIDSLGNAEFAMINNNALQLAILDSLDATFAVTSNIIRLTGFGDGGEVITTITGADVGLYTILFVDALITIEDNDAHTANTIDLLGTDTDLTSADDTTLTIMYDGTSFYEVSRSVN